MSAPEPPDDLNSRQPKILTLESGDNLHRIFSNAFDPIYFDRSKLGRLNAPDGSYGVLYVSISPNGAFAETFLRQPGRQLLPGDLLKQKAYASLQLKRPLKFAKLTGPGLSVVGATAEVTHGGMPYDIPQRWSGALRSHPRGFDGIAYTARHDDSELCLAIFEHAQDAIEIVSTVTDLDATWFWDIAEEYQIGLAPS